MCKSLIKNGSLLPWGDRDGQLYNADDYIYHTSSLTSGYNVKAIITKYDLNFKKIKTREIAQTAKDRDFGIKYYIMER